MRLLATQSDAPYSVSTASPGYLCFICCEEAVADKPFYTFEIDCRHSLCVDCYKNYLRGKIVKMANPAKSVCPQFPDYRFPEEAVEYLFVGDGATKTNNNNDNSHETSKKPKESNAKFLKSTKICLTRILLLSWIKQHSALHQTVTRSLNVPSHLKIRTAKYQGLNAPAGRNSVSPAVSTTICPLLVRLPRLGSKSARTIVKQQIGFLPTRRSVLNAIPRLRRAAGATI